MRLQIEKCIYGGAGLARAEGKAIFVPFTLPGEVVEAQIAEDKRSFANAELDAVLEPSTARTAPPCEYFGLCGGCQYQHATYQQQVALKVSILQETLQRARIVSLPEIVPVFAKPLAYRNRVRLHVQREPFALCYKKRSSNSDLPVSHCAISAPTLEHAIEVVTRTDRNFIGEFDEIEFFTNENESELLISLWNSRQITGLFPRLRDFCDALQQKLPSLAGAAVFSTRDIKVPEKKIATWEAQTLTYQAGGQAYLVSIGSFFQVNRFLIDRLVELVTANVSGKLAWDLYAGVGLFGKVLSQRFERIIAVEAALSSHENLRQNLSDGPHKTVRSGTLEFLRQKRGENPDLVVVDPPRSGLGADVVAMLTKVKTQTIIYVSCDPATLSRDLRALVESGYHLRTMHMVDLFPQTFHLESVTVLTLG